jgi:RimJ/RimL family protein N-acetyltransferase
MDVQLEKLHYALLEVVRVWRNANADFFGDTQPISRNMQQEWFDSYIVDPSDHMYAVIIDDVLPVGTIGIRSDTREIQRVMLGAKEYARTGLMSQALNMLMKAYGPGDFFLYVKQDNDKAIEFYRKNGFNRTVSVRPRPGMVSMHRYLPYTEMITS